MVFQHTQLAVKAAIPPFNTLSTQLDGKHIKQLLRHWIGCKGSYHCPIQYDLFTDVKSLDRQERLDAAIEQIRFRFGKDAIKNGVLFQKSKMPTERKVDLVMPTGMIG